MAATDELKDLLAKTALRDRTAFRSLYSRTSAKLFGVLLRILGNRAESEDALQDVYIKVWHKAGGYRPQAGTPMTWLITIARNHAIDLVRARKPVSEDMDKAVQMPDAGPSPEQNAQAAGERAEIERCLSELQTERAAAVRGAYLDGDSYQDLATRFSVPLNTMRTWLRRSLMQLRECLER